MSELVVLGAKDTALTGVPTSVGVDSQGRYYVLQPNYQELPLVFSADGRFVRWLGRAGAGPGEFRTATHVAIDATDTVFITDKENGLLSVLSPELAFVRSVAAPPFTRAVVVLTGGTIVLNASIPDRVTVGLPFHLFRRDGYRFAAAGDKNKPYLPDEGVRLLYKIAPSARGGFWSVPRFGEYLIEYWSRTGVREAAFRRSPDWHVPLPNRVGVDLGQLEPPPTPIQGIWEGKDGLIWIVGAAVDPKRKSAPRDTTRNTEGGLTITSDPDRIWDSVVEVIDPKRGMIVASQRFDMFIESVASPGRVIHMRNRPDGQPSARVLSLRLTRGN